MSTYNLRCLFLTASIILLSILIELGESNFFISTWLMWGGVSFLSTFFFLSKPKTLPTGFLITAVINLIFCSKDPDPLAYQFIFLIIAAILFLALQSLIGWLDH